LPFPKVVDQHKPDKRSVPSGYGIFYAVLSVCYWLILVFFGVDGAQPLSLATSVLFGSTMGLFDDMANLRWRYKAILPVFAALPYMVLRPSDRTTVSTLLSGSVNLGALFFLVLVPVIVTIVTNSYNQLGGLNGLEAGSGFIALFGLTLISGDWTLMGFPILVLAVLTYLSFTGKAFIGNVGSFSVGLTLAVFAIVENLKLMLLVSFLPFMANSVLILYSNYLLHDRAETLVDQDGRLYAQRIRSLRTLLLHFKHMTERQVVVALYLIMAVFVAAGAIMALL